MCRLLSATVLAICAASVQAVSDFTAINTPWRTTCFDCRSADTSQASYSVVELQSWFQYGITEDQCRNLAAALDQNYTLASGVENNLYYTYLDHSHTISSCAIVVIANCSADTNALLQSGIVGNASVEALEQGADACAFDSSQYFLNSTAQALKIATTLDSCLTAACAVPVPNIAKATDTSLYDSACT